LAPLLPATNAITRSLPCTKFRNKRALAEGLVPPKQAKPIDLGA
jgi:hypothetical protein